MRYLSRILFGLGFLLVILAAVSFQSWGPIEGLLGVLLLAGVASVCKFTRLAKVIATTSPFLGLAALLLLGLAGDVFYNALSFLTHKVRVYPVECKGKVVQGGPSGGGLCCGSLDIPLNSSTFTVSISRQQVFESTGSFWMRPLHNCEVQDVDNWQCTTYWDVTGTNETDMVQGKCFDRDVMHGGVYDFFSSGECPAASVAERLMNRALKRDFIYVDGWEWWTGQSLGWWHQHRGIWAEPPGPPYYTTHDPSLCK